MLTSDLIPAFVRKPTFMKFHIMRAQLIALLFISLAGCSIFRGDQSAKPMPLAEFDERVEIDSLWSVNRGTGTAKRQVADLSVEVLKPSEADSNGALRLISAGHEGDITVSEFESSDAAALARAPRRKDAVKLDTRIAAGPEASNTAVFVVDNDAKLVALGASELDLLWTANLSSEATAKPAANNEVVAVRTIDGALTVFDATTGERRWEYRHELPALSLRSQAQPLVTDSEVLTGFETGHIRAMNLSDGSLVWQVRVAQPSGRTDLERVVDVDTQAIIDGGSVYTASYQGNIISIDRSKGRAEWRQPFSTAKNIDYDDGSLAAVSADSEIVLLDAYSGTVEWRNSELLRRGIGAPLLTAEFVLVADDAGWVHVLDRDNGDIIGRRRLGKKTPHAALKSLGETVFLYENGRGTLKGFSLTELIIEQSELTDSENIDTEADSASQIEFGTSPAVPSLLDFDTDGELELDDTEDE